MRYLYHLILPAFGYSAAIGYPTACNTTKELDWKPCDLDFPPSLQEQILEPVDCATIDVPLDYTDENSQTLQIQLVKVNATTQPPKGRVIFAPGGPGGSGVEEVSKFGSVYRAVLGEEYDIVGYDARGVGRTIPFACTPETTIIKRNAYINDTVDLPNDDSWSLLSNKAWQEGGQFAELCYETQKDTGRFLSTAFVARDLLAISEAINEDGMLRLWGRSYGTMVGQTFAAMFPDRVERIVMDSTVLPGDFYSGLWLSATREIDGSILHFFQECIEAGPEICPLADFDGENTTPTSLMQALATALQDVQARNLTLAPDFPVLGYFQSAEGLSVLSQIKTIILNQVYRPDQYPVVLKVINDTLHGNFTEYTDFKLEDLEGQPPPPETWSKGTNALHGVMCLDASLRAADVDDMHKVVRAQLTGGGTFADVLSIPLWPCAQWKFSPAERYEGDFRDIKTKNPILFVNSPFDPVTPLSGAFEAASAFPGSRVLVHKGHGHGSSNHPSLCTLRAIRDYFNEGTLPGIGAECSPAKSGWDLVVEAVDYNGTAVVVEDVKSEQEVRMMQAVYGMVMAGFASSSGGE